MVIQHVLTLEGYCHSCHCFPWCCTRTDPGHPGHPGHEKDE